MFAMRVGQSILIVRSRVIGVEPAKAERIIQLSELPFAFECFAKGIVGSALRVSVNVGSPSPRFVKI